MPAAAVTAIITANNVAAAIEETITTPTPGLGHGRLADVMALATMVASFMGMI